MPLAGVVHPGSVSIGRRWWHSISVACDRNWGATGISPRTTPVCPIHS